MGWAKWGWMMNVGHCVKTLKTPFRTRRKGIQAYAMKGLGSFQTDYNLIGQTWHKTPWKSQSKDILKYGILKASLSPWASHGGLIKNKDGNTQFCVYHRKLKAISIKDAYPLPQIIDLIHYLASEYWQEGKVEKVKQKYKFVIECELDQFKAMPFGPCGFPTTFEWFMEKVLADL